MRKPGEFGAITFKDLRATYATWRAIRGDDPLKIHRAAGHKSLNTTQIYIRAAEDLGGHAGKPFPRLLPFLLGSTASPRPHLESVPAGARSQDGRRSRKMADVSAKPVKSGGRPASVPQLSRKVAKHL